VPVRRRSLADATGSALVEYLLLVGVVALLALQAFSVFGQDVSGTVGKEGADVAKLGF
jgi:Flp pilus assembly pilin Flp